MKFKEEIERRRTFAIVSHPDAGKTTLTEKFLLFGGAINVAGAVKSNKIKKTATSDFMEIEKQRGISVATSVMGFEYGGKKINYDLPDVVFSIDWKDFNEERLENNSEACEGNPKRLLADDYFCLVVSHVAAHWCMGIFHAADAGRRQRWCSLLW